MNWPLSASRPKPCENSTEGALTSLALAGGHSSLARTRTIHLLCSPAGPCTLAGRGWLKISQFPLSDVAAPDLSSAYRLGADLRPFRCFERRRIVLRYICTGGWLDLAQAGRWQRTVWQSRIVAYLAVRISARRTWFVRCRGPALGADIAAPACSALCLCTGICLSTVLSQNRLHAMHVREEILYACGRPARPGMKPRLEVPLSGAHAVEFNSPSIGSSRYSIYTPIGRLVTKAVEPQGSVAPLQKVLALHSTPPRLPCKCSPFCAETVHDTGQP